MIAGCADGSRLRGGHPRLSLLRVILSRLLDLLHGRPAAVPSCGRRLPALRALVLRRHGPSPPALGWCSQFSLMMPIELEFPIWTDRCAYGSWGGQRLSPGGSVTGSGHERVTAAERALMLTYPPYLDNSDVSYAPWSTFRSAASRAGCSVTLDTHSGKRRRQ